MKDEGGKVMTNLSKNSLGAHRSAHVRSDDAQHRAFVGVLVKLGVLLGVNVDVSDAVGVSVGSGVSLGGSVGSSNNPRALLPAPEGRLPKLKAAPASCQPLARPQQAKRQRLPKG
jgi:hypothetical protein